MKYDHGYFTKFFTKERDIGVIIIRTYGVVKSCLSRRVEISISENERQGENKILYLIA
jgi:hypothetical protein